MANKNNVINIQLEESYQDFVIGGEKFRVGLGDENRKKWIEADEKFREKVDSLDKFSPSDIDAMSYEEYQKMEEESKSALVYACDLLLGEGAFDKLYAICKDTLKITEVYYQVANELVGAMGKEQDELMKKFNSKMTKAKAK